MSVEITIAVQTDTNTLLPTKRQMVRVAAIIIILSLVGGLLLGLLMFSSPHGALALALAAALGNAFVTGGAAAFGAPGGRLLALEAGFVWGLCFIMVAAFFYVAWLIYYATKGNKERMTKQRMEAYCRAIAAKPLE